MRRGIDRIGETVRKVVQEGMSKVVMRESVR